MSPYAELEYRRARAALTPASMCWRNCGRQATTIDHVPALARHDHVAGSGCCRCLPCCPRCNYGHGARLVNERRRGVRHTYAERRW